MFHVCHCRNWRAGSVLSSVLLLLAAVASHGDALDSLHLRNPLPTPETVRTIGFGGGKFLAADERGDVFTSVNGTSWTAVGNVGANFLTKIVYGNGRFVATSGSGNVLSTADGAAWDLVPLTTQNRIQRIAFGNGVFLISTTDLAGNAVMHTSVDGLSWTTNSPSLPAGSGVFVSIAFGDGVFAAIAFGYIHTSPDGVTWTSHVPQGDAQVGTYLDARAIGYGNGRFVVAGTGWKAPSGFSAKWISTNHVDWVRASSSPDSIEVGNSITFGNGVFFATGLGLWSYTTVDGVTWQPVALPAGIYNFESVAFGNGTFVGVSIYRMATSTDAVNWTNVAIVPADRDFAATGGAYGAGRYVLSGDIAVTSTDGINFSRMSFSAGGPPAAINCVVYAGGQFLAATGSEFMRSSDGVNWSRARSGVFKRINAIAHGLGKYVAVGEGGVIRVSNDGTLWTGAISDTEYHLKGVAFGGGRFVAVGTSGLVLASTDGNHWSQQVNPDFSDLSGVVYGQGQFVAVGAGGAVLTSPDGTAWTRRSSAIAAALNGVSYGEGLFVAVANGRVITSTDGVTWQERISESFGPLYGGAFLNNTFMLVGDGGTILQSDPVGVAVLSAAANVQTGVFEVQITNSELGGVYRLQSCTNLSVGLWTDVTTFTQTQTVTTVAVPGGVGAPQCYYRAVTP